MPEHNMDNASRGLVMCQSLGLNTEF